MNYCFCLGREQKIALAELESVLRRFCFDFEELNLSLDGNCAIINIQNKYDDEVAGLIENLGGTLKIYKIVAPGDNKLSNQIASLIVDKFRGSKINFGISNYAGERLGQGLGASIKTNLKYRKVNSRYVKPKEGEILSSAESWHNIIKKGGIEFGIITTTELCHGKDTEESKSEYWISKHETISNDKNSKKLRRYNLKAVGVLLAVSNPDEWAKKDFGKPRSDAKSGMMPPKLARALANIACGQAMINNQDTITKQITNPNDQIQNDQCRSVDKISGSVSPIIFDPFCGSGNILIEALDMGFSVAGSDISERAVEDTRANLEWLQNRQPLTVDRQPKEAPEAHEALEANKPRSYDLKAIDVLDAAKADFSKLLMIDDKRSSVNDQRSTVVVTEPYLGTP